MANQWLRLWHDMPTDPKWRTIARTAGRDIAEVMATYTILLVKASENDERGYVPGLICHECHECHAPSRSAVTCHDQNLIECLSTALDIEIDAVIAILAAMQGRVLDGDWVAGWERRQPKKEDAGSPETGALSATERKRISRQRQREEKAKRLLEDKNRDSISGHDESRNVTTDKDKEEDKDKELKPAPAKPSTAAAVREVFEFWKTKLGHQRAVFDPKRQRLIEARLKDFTVDDLKAAITGCSLSPHHMGKNDTGTRYDSLELILRDAGKVEFFQQIKPLQNQHPVTSTIPLDTVPIDWRHSNAGIEAKARELGMEQGSDQYPVFKRKVIAAAQAQENPQ